MLQLPKGYLSNSAIDLWEKDKPRYRKRYYLGEKSGDTVFTYFGKEIHKQIEEKKIKVPRYNKPEHRILTEIEGVPILAILDSFHDKRFAFLDYKTGGEGKWNQVKVQQLEQLPFYSTVVKASCGSVQ